MKPCDHIREMFLEHLYGLLEPRETAELNEHLSECVDCRAELARVERQKILLGKAARTEVGDFRFEKPKDVALPALRITSRRVWLRWAVAASILLMAGGFGIPGGLYLKQQRLVERGQDQLQGIYTKAGNIQRKHRDQVAQADRQLGEIREEIQKIQTDWPQERTRVLGERAQQNIDVTVSAPRTLQAGAANPIRIDIKDLAGRPVPAEVSVQVLNRNQQVVFEKDRLQGQANYLVSLSPNVPVQPDEELTLAVSAKGDQGQQGRLSEKLSLIAPLYLTHLATDKPMYQPGETVHFRSLSLERFSLKPAAEPLQLAFTITKPTSEKAEIVHGITQVVKEKENVPILGPDNKPLRGIGAGEYLIPPDAPGGEYTLTVSEAGNRFPSQERKFMVNRYEKPRLNKELEFTAKAYGPGDTVVAACKVARVEEKDKPLVGIPVTAEIKIDGTPYAANGQPGGPLNLRTNDRGGVSVRFTLPRVIQKGQATLSLIFQDGGINETMVRPIPIVLKKLNVEFFPEGGDLVAGLPNRVYFQVRTTLDKPAELKGRIVDDSGQATAKVETFNDQEHPEANQGMGLFSFSPQAGRKYQLKIDNPVGIEGTYFLPEVKADGVVLSVPTGVTGDKDSIKVRLHNGGKERSLLVGVYCRGRLMAHQTLAVKNGEMKEVELQPESGVGGVYRVTVFEEFPGDGHQKTLVPETERLIYRVPAERLNITMKADKTSYVPREKVSVDFESSNEKKEPAPAILMVAVVDKSVLKLADEKTYRSMPAHFWLTTEVRRPEDLEHADFLLSAKPQAATALDLLLGTQGWRRFAEQDPGKFQKDQKEEAQRLLVLEGQFPPRNVNVFQEKLQKLDDSYQTKLGELQERQVKTNQDLESARKGERFQQELDQLKVEASRLEKDQGMAVSTLNRYRYILRNVVLPIGAGLFLLVGVISLIVGLSRLKSPVALPYLATAACSIILFGLLYTIQFGFDDASTKVGTPQARVAGITRAPAAAAEKTAKAEKFKLAELEIQADAKKFGMEPEMAEERLEALRLGDRFGGVPPQAAAAGKAGAVLKAAPADQERAPERRLAAPAKPGDGKDLQFMFKDADKLDGLAENQKHMLGLIEAEKKPGREQQLAKRAGAKEAKQAELGRELPAGDVAAGRMPQLRGGDFGHPGDGRINLRRALRNDRNAAFVPGDIPPPPPVPLVVREYAHVHSHGESQVREDFTETLFWQPVLVLPDGKGKISFELCDSVTTFQVLAAGHTLDGRLAEATTEVTSQKPLTLQPKLPIEITDSDEIDVPLSIANNTSNQQSVDLRVQSDVLNLIAGKQSENFILHPEQRARRIYRFVPNIIDDVANLRFTGEGKSINDSMAARIKVVPQGFPIVGSQSDLLEGTARHDLVLPEAWITGTLKYHVTIYPSTLASLQKGLEGLLREPNGCFEQTSTTNYPNLLILSYLKETNQARPEIARQAQDLLTRGYQKLTSFECLNTGKNQREGYEWFGGTAPAHEALTAYGLMEFRDMAQVYDVDKAMLERTRTYLMNQKDGQGGFKRNPQALDTFGRAPDNITNAYIVWALTESGRDDDVTKELTALAEQAKTSKDPYFLALVANSLLNRDGAEAGIGLLKRVAELQDKDGHLDAAQTSITGSGGRDLQIETTALSLYAWLKAKRPELFNRNIQSAVKWIGQQRGGYGGFGSTQSTILALKAIIAYARANKKTAEAGDLVLYLDDKEVSRHHFPAGAEEAVTLELRDAEKLLKSGKNALRVEVTGKNSFPYTATWSYRTLKPASAEKCPVGLITKLDRDTANEGETVRLTVQVENQSGKGQGMTVAIVGLPAGLTLPEDMKQLKDMARLRENGTKPGEISAWEIRGRELVLYWRDLAPEKKIEVNLELICRVPGQYSGPASRAYLYYNADTKCWVDPLKIKIAAKQEN
jgi:hypothetical protein